MNELETKLLELMGAMGVSVDEFVSSKISEVVALNNTSVSDIQSKLNMIETAIDGVADGDISVAQNIISQITGLSSAVTSIANRVTVNESDISGLKTRVTDAETVNAAQDNRLSTVEAVNAAQESKILDLENANIANTAKQLAQDDLIANNTSSLAQLNGDETVAGSVSKKIKDAISIEEGLRVAGDDALQAQINSIATSTSNVSSELAAMQNEVDVTQAAIGLNADGTYTPVDGSDTLLEYVQDINSDANSLNKALRKLAKKSKQADMALASQLADEVVARSDADAINANLIQAETTRATAAEANLAASIEGETARAMAAEAALSNNNLSLQSELDATQVALGANINSSGEYVSKTGKNYINGKTSISSEIDALDAAIKNTNDALSSMGSGSVTELTDRVTGVETVVNDLQNNKLDTVKVTSLDICLLNNMFRSKLTGLAPKDCGDAPAGGGSGL